MNFAKRCCADDANLCEIISVSPEKEETAQQFINEFLENNNFNVRYREQLEKTSATGTVGAYIYLQNAEYIKAIMILWKLEVERYGLITAMQIVSFH